MDQQSPIFRLTYFGCCVLLLFCNPESIYAAGACAHRGDASKAPENTLVSIHSAIESGAQQVEFDVQFSKDHELVLMHDDTVDRTTNGTGRVSDLSLAELRNLDAGSWYDESFRGTNIPLLSEVLSIDPHPVIFNVHIKGEVELARAVAWEIVEHDATDRCFLTLGGQGAHEACAAARAAVSDIMICLGHPAAVQVRKDITNLPSQVLEPYRLSDGVVPFRSSIDFIQLYHWEENIPIDLVCDTVRMLHHNEILVNYCCADQEEKIVALDDAGVDYILTNDLDTCLAVLERE